MLGISVLCMLIEAVLLSTFVYVVYAESDAKDLVLGRVGELVKRLEVLSRDGVNTSMAEYYINCALAVLNSECYTVECLGWVWSNLTIAEREISRLEDAHPGYVMWRNFSLGATVAGLVTIPIFIYVFLPRLWAYAWYAARRKWIVVEKKSRKEGER